MKMGEGGQSSGNAEKQFYMLIYDMYFITAIFTFLLTKQYVQLFKLFQLQIN